MPRMPQAGKMQLPPMGSRSFWIARVARSTVAFLTGVSSTSQPLPVHEAPTRERE